MVTPVRVSCRVCGSPRTSDQGTVEYLKGFPRQVFDCDECGCRFTSAAADIHEQLHASPAISYYVTYRELAQKSRQFFDGGDVAGLKRALREEPKYALVIDAIDKQPMTAVLLEVGCSRGYLTSCFILEGRNILGVDVSPEAVNAAKETFGDHFAVAGSAVAEKAGPFDVIYHVGTIGCVPDPVGLTTRLLARLTPGGRLIFNAPNRAALRDDDQLWFDTAPPPEMITLFPPGFFASQFSRMATVTESIGMLTPAASFAIGLRLSLGRRWTPPTPKPLSGADGQVWTQPAGGVTSLVERVINRAARAVGLTNAAAVRPAEYGLFVEMVKQP